MHGHLKSACQPPLELIDNSRPIMRITALHSAHGRVPGLVELPQHPTDSRSYTLNNKPPLVLEMERRFVEMIEAHPELLGPNEAVHHAPPRTAVEWLLELLNTSTPSDVANWADLELIALAHSTLDHDVFHAPAARIKHELKARRALPFAIGQSQSNAIFHALRLLSAWARSGASAQARALLCTVEKRRFPLVSHMSVGVPISDGVGFAVLSVAEGPGLSLHSVCLEAALMATEAECFETLLDKGHDAHARTLAESLWRCCRAQRSAVLSAGPNLRGGIAAQVQRKLAELSDGQVLPIPPSEHFFMATDPLVVLERTEACNKNRLPILLWSLDDRLALGAALFEGDLQSGRPE